MLTSWQSLRVLLLIGLLCWRISLPIWHANLRWNFQCFFDDFEFKHQNLKVVESTFQHRSDDFERLFRIRGGELSFFRLGCHHLQKVIKKAWEFPFRFWGIVFAREVLKKIKQPPLAAPTKAQFSNHSCGCSGSKTCGQQIGTWMTIFLDESDNFHEKVWNS